MTFGCSEKQPSEYCTSQKAYELGYKSSQIGYVNNPFDKHFQTYLNIAWENGWIDGELAKKGLPKDQYKGK